MLVKHIRSLARAAKFQTDIRRMLPNTGMGFKAIAVPAIGLAVALVTGLATGKIFLISLALQLISLPLVMFLYMSRRNVRTEIITPLAPALTGWSIVGFAFALVASGNWSYYGLIMGAVAGVFSRIDPLRFLMDIKKEPRNAGALLAAMLSGPILIIIQKTGWMLWAQTTANGMAVLLAPFFKTIDVVTRTQLLRGAGDYGAIKSALSGLGVTISRKSINFVMLVTENDTFIKIISTKNVATGLCLLLLMLGIWVIFQPRLLQLVHPVKLYLFGIGFVWLGNVIWLSLLYLLLPPLNNVTPDTINAQVKSLMAVDTNLFYSWAGYIVLTLAALLTMRYLFYKPALRRQNT